MQHVDPESPHYDEFRQYQAKLQQRLRDLRRQHGLTQLDLAECGISPRHYTRLEQDPTRIISIWQLYKIAAYYKIPLSELLQTD